MEIFFWKAKVNRPPCDELKYERLGLSWNDGLTGNST